MTFTMEEERNNPRIAINGNKVFLKLHRYDSRRTIPRGWKHTENHVVRRNLWAGQSFLVEDSLPIVAYKVQGSFLLFILAIDSDDQVRRILFLYLKGLKP